MIDYEQNGKIPDLTRPSPACRVGTTNDERNAMYAVTVYFKDFGKAHEFVNLVESFDGVEFVADVDEEN